MRPTRIRENKMYLFKSKEEKARLSNIKNLIALAMADGKVERSELAAIAAVAERDNIDEKEIKKILEGKDKVKFVVPETNSEKIRFLQDMVALMMIDGNIDDNEFALCKLVAIDFGYRHEVIDAMILDIIASLKSESI